MKCDACHKDFTIWTDLHPNGRVFYRDEAVRSYEGGKSIKIKVRKVMVCVPCLAKGPEYQPGEVPSNS